MLVSKATKLLELGHSDFDQVYAMYLLLEHLNIELT